MLVAVKTGQELFRKELREYSFFKKSEGSERLLYIRMTMKEVRAADGGNDGVVGRVNDYMEEAEQKKEIH